MRILIVGAGHAGVAMAEALRKRGCIGPIHLVDGVAGLPVERPPLSKAWLTGAADAPRPLLRGEAWYGEQDITLITGNPVVGIAGKRATLGDGREVEFTHLVLATGADPRRLIVADATTDDGLVLRNADDATRLATALEAAKNLVVIGGGYIGLEVAASARAREREQGVGVTVIEAATRILARVASNPASAYFENLHREHGVEIITSAKVEGIEDNGAGVSVATDKGDFAADCVLVGIGVTPAMALAQSLGLECGDGIMVDGRYRTATPDIYAIGDVALCRGGYTAGRTRIESVHHAQMSAEIAAADIMGGEAIAHETPWFWSDQYDARLQSVGLVPQGDKTVTITRPGRREGSCSFWSFDGDGILRAVEAVGDAAAYMLGRKLVDGDVVNPDMVAAADFDPKAVLRGLK